MENQPYGIFDYSELPLVKIRYTGAKATDENFSAYLAEMGTIFKKTERYISLLDTTEATYLSVKHRIMQGKYVEENQERIKKQAIAAVFIAPSFLHRTILKAIFMIKEYPSKVFIVSSKEEGTKKINELLEEENKTTNSKQNEE